MIMKVLGPSDPDSGCHPGEVVLPTPGDPETFTGVQSNKTCLWAEVVEADLPADEAASIQMHMGRDLELELEYAEIGSRCRRDVAGETDGGLIYWVS